MKHSLVFCFFLGYNKDNLNYIFGGVFIMKCFRRVCSLILAMAILCSVCMVIPAVSAKVGNGNPCAESSLKVDKNMKTVTVNYYVTTEKKIEDFQGYLTYDENVLQINQLNQKVTDGMMYNEKRTGKIYFAGVNIDPKFDFTAETLLFSAVFDVISDGDTSVNAVIDLADDEDDETIVDSANDINSGSVDTRVEILPTLRFSSASLTLESSLSVNYYVNEVNLSGYDKESVYAEFELNGYVTKVDYYDIVERKVGDKVIPAYKFSFRGISPNRAGDTIKATLYAKKGNEYYSSNINEYSVIQYCNNQLKTEDAKLRTLLVDLLNYASASQVYTNYKTDNLVNNSLTEEQKSWATAELDELKSVTNTQYEVIDSPNIEWKSASLILSESVIMNFGFELKIDSLENVKFRIETEDYKCDIPAEYAKYNENNSRYYIEFNGLGASKMSETVYVTAYKNGKAISNTLSYSIESYVKAKQNSSDSKLANLVDKIMKYGKSAFNYVNQ